MTSISADVIWGVAGKYCAGKNALIRFLIQKGFSVIDCDRIGHQVLKREKQKKRVLKRFGAQVLTTDGEIDRKELGKLVFRYSCARRDLEKILHPEMVKEVKSRLETLKRPVAINAAVLFRMGLQQFCSLVICVQAPLTVRLFRAIKRDRLSFSQALMRILSQRRICPKFNVNGVDIYSMKNNGSLIQLQEQAHELLKERGIKELHHG